MNNTSLFARLPELLRWREDCPLAPHLLGIYHRHAAERLAHTLARIDAFDATRGQMLRERLYELPAPVFLRLLTAPQTWYLVAGCKDAQPAPGVLARYLTDSLDAEEAIANGADAHERALWSCLGDAYLPAQHEPSLPARPGALLWHVSRPFTAPQLPGGLPVDFWSPHARGPLPDIAGSDVDPELEDIAIALDKLCVAAHATLEVCPLVWKFVLRFSRVIVVRKDPLATRKYTSASSRIALGRPILRNPHVPSATPMELIDSLVYESIHGVVDIVELESPIVMVDKVLRDSRVDSPWTGQSLDINTYVQSCFVWFGLWNFWSSVFGGWGFPARQVLDYMGLCSRGFLHGDVARQLVPVSGALAPGLIDVLRSMQAEVCDAMDVIEQVAKRVVRQDGGDTRLRDS